MKRAIKRFMASTGVTRGLYAFMLLLLHRGVKVAFATLKRSIRGSGELKSVWALGEQSQNPDGYIYREPSNEVLTMQREETFARAVRFSILTPLYNTERRYLIEMIRSVQRQSYGNWELCLADGSDSKHGYIKRVCMRLARRDGRIKYMKLERNLGIAGNTNACLEMASGDFCSFLDHDDLLTPDALYETARAICEHDAQFIYSDEDKVDAKTLNFSAPVFKPDYAPDFLRGFNYICHFVTVSREIVDEAGFLDGGYDGAQDYDFVLRTTERASRIYHVPKVLYHWRAHSDSTAKGVGIKSYAIEAGRRAIVAHLERVGLSGSVLQLAVEGLYRVRYELKCTPLITILIPNKDHVDDLDRCLSSIIEKTSYANYEVVIIENNSGDKGTFDYYDGLSKHERVKVAYYDGAFSYSKVNNFGAGHARGDYFVFLNNDTEVITEGWLEEMLGYAQRGDVGVVGAMLWFPDFRVQHAGLVVGLANVASHIIHGRPLMEGSFYVRRIQTTQNYSAVTAACMMMRRDLFLDVGGFNEDYAVAYNDIDLCMKVRARGLLVVWTPFCEMFHHELTTRGPNDTTEKVALELRERTLFETRWRGYWEKGDPYYNVNYDRREANFVIGYQGRLK